MHFPTRFGSIGLVLVMTACAGAGDGPSAPAPQGEGGEASESPFEAWDDVLKDTRAIDGFFTTHLKRDNTLYFEIPAERLEDDFGMVMHYSRGVGVYNAHDGLPLSAMQLMHFRRDGDKVYLIHRNPRFTADEGSPMRASLDDNVGHSVTAAFDIASENDSTGALLIDATPFIVSDYAEIGSSLKNYHGNTPVSLDGGRSHVSGVMGFPENVEIDAALTFSASESPGASAAGVSDYRSIPIGVRYSIISLPEEPMARRPADDRVGNFLNAQRDFSRQTDETQYVRYVNRWRLEKQDPSSELSEPIEPIVYYIDRSVPEEYRQYVREGIEAWNKAFEAAGFRNAIVAEDPPENDTTWSAEDARYSTVRWTAAHQMGYAIGPSQTDPRTGEILNADVLISSTFVNGWASEYSEMVGPEALFARMNGAETLREQLPGHLADRICLAEMGRAHQLGFQHAMLAGLGVIDGTEPMPEEYLGNAIRDLIMHEIGHTLGLRHNFKGSSAIPYERLNDQRFTRENGLTLSVMDYAPTNISPDTALQGDYVNMEVGSYDVWAIKYAYSPIYEQPADGPFAMAGTPLGDDPEAELAALQKIAGQAADPLHAYNSDEDTHLGPMAVDPLSNTWDLSSDPIRWAAERAELVERVRPTLEDRLIDEGDGYQRMRNAVAGLTFERLGALQPVSKVVGGLYFARDHKGDPDGRLPFTPVSAERQRQAVQFMVDQAFAPDAFEFEADVLNKMAPNRYSDWGNSTFFSPIDFPIHGMVGGMQATILGALLHNGRLARMIDNEVRMPNGAEAYTVAELFSTLTDAIWLEITPPRAPGSIDSFRRNLQRTHLQEMIDILHDIRTPGTPPAPEDARSLARLELNDISDRLQRALRSGSLDRTTRAHLMESQARIARALDASLMLSTD